MQNRRNFIASMTAAAGIGLIPASAKDLVKLGARPVDWQELIDGLGGGVYQYNDRNFALKARVNNLRYMRKLPQAVAIIDTADKAAFAIDWCRQNSDVDFRIKGGGHSYAGFSTCEGLVLLTQGLDETIVRDHSIQVGAGAINYSVYDALSKHQRSITHGRCPTVGIAGFVLGGGIGFDMRRYGMACDLLEEAEIVTAQGQKITASATQHADLFWAIRGGAGGNFGLSTSFTFKTFDISQEYVHAFERVYTVEDRASSGIAHTSQLLMNIMKQCEASPVGLGTRISVQYIKTPANAPDDNYFKIDFLGQWAGDDWRQCRDLLNFTDDYARAHGADIDPKLDFIASPGRYWEAQQKLSEPEELYFYQERSTFIKSTPDIAEISEALTLLTARPDVSGPCDLRFFQTGGNINDKSSDETAFAHRDSQWLALVGYYWDGGDDLDAQVISQGHEWQDQYYQTVLYGERSLFSGVGAYQNFPDLSLKNNWAQAYYGANLDRLRQVKQTYDPTRLFKFSQAI